VTQNKETGFSLCRTHSSSSRETCAACC
jgi:hypothetical protein